MPYLPQAVDSILKQTWTDFEFIVVNDCSTDGTSDYLKSLTDSRIVQLDLPVNCGVTAALQAGLKAVRGEFIARLDADDIAYPTRLEKQVAFMRQNSNVGLLGSFADTIDMNGSLLPPGKRVEKSDIDLRWDLLFKNPFVHSTVMFRTKLVNEFRLRYHLQHAEDYDLWAELAQVTELALLPEPLIQYRVNPKSWTYTKANEQNLGGAFVSDREIARLVNTQPEIMERIRTWVRAGGNMKSDDLSVFIELIHTFLRQNSHSLTPEFIKRQRQHLRKRLGLRAVKEVLYWQLLIWRQPV